MDFNCAYVCPCVSPVGISNRVNLQQTASVVINTVTELMVINMITNHNTAEVAVNLLNIIIIN